MTGKSAPSRVVALVGAGVALVLWGTVVFSAQGGGANQVNPAIDPHFDAKQCGQCHALKEGRPVPIGVDEVDRVCLRCHDGRAASGESHPVGRAASPKRPVPEGWPLNEGKLNCVTCHAVQKACNVNARRSDLTRNLLRGVTGEAARVHFCENCHEPAQYQRFNPHLMLTKDRQVIESKCASCHTKPLDRAVTKRTGQANLRAGELTLCLACHVRHPDVFSPGHLGARVKPDMLAVIRAREIVGLVTPPGPELLTQLKTAHAKPTLIATAADGTITCSTCHNPHQAGVFAPGTPLAFRPMRVVGDKAVSPVRGGQFCNHCHDM
jgi:hypothetical protein